MGRILASVKIDNVRVPAKTIRCDALVDTGAAYMVLPSAWKERLGNLESMDTVEVQTATQETIRGTICGPVRIEVEGFRAIYNEVLFIDMTPENGSYEPLIGYLVLEQCQAAVDMLGHRLIRVRHVDLK
jgi:predicted aspartyl protease